MYKHLLICAAAVAFGAVNAQGQDVILRKAELPGADFDIVFAMSSPQAAANIDHGGQHDPLIIYSIGGELAHAVEGEVEKMFKDVGFPRVPIQSFRVELRGSTSNALNVYVVPRLAQFNRTGPVFPS